MKDVFYLQLETVGLALPAYPIKDVVVDVIRFGH